MQPDPLKQDIASCLEIVTAFYRHLDRGEFTRLLALMTHDGIYHRPNGKAVPAGPELLADLSQRSDTVTMAHLLTNLYAESTGPDSMDVHGYMTVFIQDDGKPHAGAAPIPSPKSIYNLNISLVKIAGDWRIARLKNSKRFATVA